MSDELPPEDTEPRSDQLNADQLLSGPVTVTITCCRLTGDKKQPWAVDLEEYPGRPFKPCLTMRRILQAAFGKYMSAWAGQQLTLYRDPEVLWAGEKKGGVRISAMSKLPKLNPFPVTLSRGKTTNVALKPITGLTADQREFIANATREIEEADEKTLDGYVEILKKQPEAVRLVLRPIYSKRKQELTDADH